MVSGNNQEKELVKSYLFIRFLDVGKHTFSSVRAREVHKMGKP